MEGFRTFVIGLAVAATLPVSATQTPSADDRLLADLAHRLQTYTELKEAAAKPVFPLVSLDDAAEVRVRTDALAAVIRRARWDARQGDIFTADIARLIRGAIRRGCDGDFTLR